MATTSKLEMSLDDIIKSNKSKEAKGKKQLGGKFGVGARKGQTFKKRVIGGPKGMKFGNKRIGQQIMKKIGSAPRRVGGNFRRKVIGGGNRVVIVKRARNNNKLLLQNRAVISATQNLVQKLVKKALNQTNIGNVASGRGKIRRVPINNIQRARTIILNKVNPRSRVIGRRPRIVTQQQQQPIIVQRVRGRGPVRFATAAPIMQTAVVRRNFIPKRRFNTVRYVQQQQQPTTVIVQQKSPRQQQAQRNVQSLQTMSVRDHINALRRASTLQQLQAQFVNQQQPRQQFMATQLQPQRRRPQQQPQQIIVTQQRTLPRRRRPQFQQQQQPIVMRQQFAAFGRGGGGGGRRGQRQPRQQQIMLDPLYEPPNFLQRL